MIGRSFRQLYQILRRFLNEDISGIPHPRHEYRVFSLGVENVWRRFGLNPPCDSSHNLKVGDFSLGFTLRLKFKQLKISPNKIPEHVEKKYLMVVELFHLVFHLDKVFIYLAISTLIYPWRKKSSNTIKYLYSFVFILHLISSENN